MKLSRNTARAIVLIMMVVLLCVVGGYILSRNNLSERRNIPRNKHTAFLMETYDVIQKNYWNKVPENKLVELYTLGVEKIGSQMITPKPNNRQGLQAMLDRVIEKTGDDNAKKEFVVALADAVLAGLAPQGRSRLYTQKEEMSLSNNVNNINPEEDLYKNLGVAKTASPEAIKKTYEVKSQELAKDNSSAGKLNLAKVTKAYQTLSDETSKKTYDQLGIEPTMEYRLTRPDIFYIHLIKFAPTTNDELSKVTTKVDTGDKLDTLILDLRDNVGGAIDGLPYFLGPFIGNDQYAYQFYHQGEKQDFKTKTGWLNSLVRYRKTIILVNSGTMSSAEVMAATLKKYNVGVLIGTTTKGWGTVERVFELKNQIDNNQKYSVFLVHSLTLREDGLPIEGRGVEPNISLTTKDWQKELLSRFGNQNIVNAVNEILY